jgi:hypothetical protein
VERTLAQEFLPSSAGLQELEEEKKLAALRDKRCRSSVEDIIEALRGDYREEYLFVLGQSQKTYPQLREAIAACDGKLGELDRPETGEACPVHDTVQRSWEHLRFFEHRTAIRARVPRITTPSGAVKTVEVPWARPNGGFTLLLEAWLLAMAKVLPVAEVSWQTSVRTGSGT